MKVDFPPAFDINYYRKSYPELNGMPDEVVTEHYRRYAEERGLSVCFYDKAEFMRAFISDFIKENPVKVLEIGPYDNPACIGDNVKYFDVHDSETLKVLAEKEKRPFKNTPEKIHYVEPNGDLSIVKEKFDIVFSSHCIEHQPDLIRHLQNVENLLNEGGLYVLVIPDKRYCFDHFRNGSTLFEVIGAAVENRTIHNFKSVSEYNCLHTHNNSVLHWLGEHGTGTFSSEKFASAIDSYEKSINEGRYLDVHAWCFTPKIFGDIIEDLNSLGMINLKIYRLCHTVWGRFEFSAVLKKNSVR